MPARNPDLHGMVPDKSEVALLLIDVINDLDFPEGDQLFPQALEAAKQIARLKQKAREADIPVIYVNDNFGRWQSDLGRLFEHCTREPVRGRPIAELLAPGDEDYFVLKPKHSAFFSTTLDVLLSYLGVRTLILTGFAGNLCILFTANDAYMRDFNLVVPADCVASNEPQENRSALEQMRKYLHADITKSTRLDLAELKQRARRRPGQHPQEEPQRKAA